MRWVSFSLNNLITKLDLNYFKKTYRCEKEYFYDDLNLNGDFKIPEGDWFCSSCGPSTNKGKSTGKKISNTKKDNNEVKTTTRRSTRKN